MEEVMDEQLMARYAGGDAGAFDALFRRYVLVTGKVGGVGCPELAGDAAKSAVALRKLAFRTMPRRRAAADLPAAAIHAR